MNVTVTGGCGFIGSTVAKAFRMNQDIIQVVSLVCIFMTEPLVSQGTTYHEPLLLLFGILSFIPNYIGLLFFSASVSVKFSFIFLSLLVLWYTFILCYKCKIPSKVYFSIVLISSLLILGTQLLKNYSLTRRILAPTKYFRINY